MSQEEQKMHGCLHQVLQEIEKTNFLFDTEVDPIIRLWGYVPDYIVDDFMRKGYLFSESAYSIKGVIHGVHAHRIQLAVLQILIDKNIVKLQPGQKLKSLLQEIIRTRNWGMMFDNSFARFNSPCYLMSYLRDAEHLPKLQQYAIFSFFKAVNKLLELNNLSEADYEWFVYGTLALGNFFPANVPNPALIEKIQTKAVHGKLTIGNRYLFYHKPKAVATTPVAELRTDPQDSSVPTSHT